MCCWFPGLAVVWSSQHKYSIHPSTRSPDSWKYIAFRVSEQQISGCICDMRGRASVYKSQRERACWASWEWTRRDSRRCLWATEGDKTHTVWERERAHTLITSHLSHPPHPPLPLLDLLIAFAVMSGELCGGRSECDTEGEGEGEADPRRVTLYIAETVHRSI